VAPGEGVASWEGRTRAELASGSGSVFSMAMRAFPVVYANDVERAARFWERLGFGRFFQLPEDGIPGYVGLRRETAELAVVAAEWSKERYGLNLGDARGSRCSCTWRT
jgi:hypothetical protein